MIMMLKHGKLSASRSSMVVLIEENVGQNIGHQW